MKHYRKAEHDDVKCSECIFKATDVLRLQLRCSCGHDLGESHAVSKHNTCDEAEAKVESETNDA